MPPLAPPFPPRSTRLAASPPPCQTQDWNTVCCGRVETGGECGRPRGKGARNAPRPGCLGRCSGPGAWHSPRSQPPVFTLPETPLCAVPVQGGPCHQVGPWRRRAGGGGGIHCGRCHAMCVTSRVPAPFADPCPPRAAFKEEEPARWSGVKGERQGAITAPRRGEFEGAIGSKRQNGSLGTPDAADPPPPAPRGGPGSPFPLEWNRQRQTSNTSNEEDGRTRRAQCAGGRASGSVCPGALETPRWPPNPFDPVLSTVVESQRRGNGGSRLSLAPLPVLRGFERG